MFLVLMASFFWGHAVVNIALGILLLGHLSMLIKNWRSKKPRFDIMLLPILAYFGLFVLSRIIDTNQQAAINTVERSIYYPLILITLWLGIRTYTQKQIDRALFAYVFSNIVSSIFLIATAVHKTWIYGSVNPFNVANGNHFSYHAFTEVLNFHAVYYGLFTITSIGILLDFILRKKTYGREWLFVIAIAYLSVITLLLSSFMLVIILAGIYLCYLIFKLQQKRNLWSWRPLNILVLVCSLIVLGFGSIFIVEKSKGLSLHEDFKVENISGEEFTAVRARVMKAYSSWQLIKQKPIEGYGTGNSQIALRQSYLEHGFQHGYEENYNSHNQYLTTTLHFGVIGLFILLLYILIVATALRQLPFLTSIFLITCLLIFFSESILERQHGVLWFAFFSGFVYFRAKQHYNHV